MNTLYFFGDSWPAENIEIDSIMNCKGMTFDSYPTIVGQRLGVPIKNCAVAGSSQEHMIVQLLSSGIKAGDHAVFSLTTPSRRMIYNDANEIEHQFVDPCKSGVNEFNDQWRSANALYVLYQYCRSKEIHPWFVCTFNVTCLDVVYRSGQVIEYNNPLWKEIPDHCWLMPKNQCLVEKIFDPEFFNQRSAYLNCNFQEWLDTENAQVQRYIRPCQYHPNGVGRTAIAEWIAAEITQRIK
jgi:hypothetical protein